MAQTCPPTTVDPPTQHATIQVEYGNPGVCTLADDGYIKSGNSYKLHVAASVSGSCQIYAQNAVCTPASGLQYRTIGYTQFTDQTEYWAAYPGLVTTTGPYSYDTHTPTNNSGPASFWPTVLGAHTLTASTQASTTDCGFQGSFPADNTLTVNVLKCLPKWKTNTSDGIFRWAQDSSLVTNYIYVPQSLRGGDLDLALPGVVTTWNNALIAAGINQRFERTETFVTLTVLSSRSNWNSSFIPFTLAHELLHTLGLDENTCTYQSSLMGTFSQCGQNVTGYTAPSITDMKPVEKTVY